MALLPNGQHALNSRRWNQKQAARYEGQQAAFSEEIPDAVQKMQQIIRTSKIKLHKYTTRKIRSISANSRPRATCVKKLYLIIASQRADPVSRKYLCVK